MASALSLPPRRLEEFLAERALLSGRSQSVFHRAQVSLSMEGGLKSGLLFKWRKTLKSKPEFKPPFIDNETWARWKADWEHPDNKAVSARNSSNRRGGKDKAEATHIGGSIPHARTMRDFVSI